MSRTQSEHAFDPSARRDPEETLRRVVIEVLDDDVWELIEFSPRLKLVEGLDLSSVDFVMIVDKLTRAYGGTVDFVSWLRSMKRQQVIALTIQDIAEFIRSREEPRHG